MLCMFCSKSGKITTDKLNKNDMRTYPKIIKHTCKLGDEIRLTITDQGEVWFNAIDVLQTVELSWGGHMLDRLTTFETRRIPCEGKSMRFVNSTGLLVLMGPKQEYLRARKIIVELLQKYSRV